jgi:hypothetical protein
MPGRVLRLDDLALWYLIIGVGLTWSAAFAVTALFYSPVAGFDLDTAMPPLGARYQSKANEINAGQPK